MARAILATVTFDHVSGLPEDRVVNNFVANSPGAGVPTDAQFDDFLADLAAFYNDDNTLDPVCKRLSPELVSGGLATIVRFYDLDGHLDGSAHGSPVYESSFSLGAPYGNAPLPAECAVVLTTRAIGWQTAPVETPDDGDADALVQRPKQRLSGRVYIGSLNGGASTVVSGAARVAGDFVTDLLDAGERLWNDLAGHGWAWAVWSRRNEASIGITHLQVDNAFDTMRKRGPDPTARTTRGPFVP